MIFSKLPSKGALSLATILAICASAGPAFAADIPANLSNSLSYRVVGKISASCSVVQGQHDVSVVGLQNPSTDTVQQTETLLPFSVSCSAPVKVTMASLNGGLKTSAATGDGDFASAVPYRATLDMPGASNVLHCQSDAMAAGGSGCSRNDVGQVAFSGAGKIRIATQASDKLLLAGRYSDTVTLTISPMLDGGGD